MSNELTQPKTWARPPAIITKSQQDASAAFYMMVGKLKVYIEIRSNAYKFQSHAFAKVWSQKDLRWNLVFEIPHAAMKTPAGLYVADNLNEVSFSEDIEKLIEGATAILL